MNETRPPPRPPELSAKSPEQQHISPTPTGHKIPLNSSSLKPTPIHSNISMDRRAEYTMRRRADSVESTRGALFGSSTMENISPKKRSDRRGDTIPQKQVPSRRHNARVGNQPTENHESPGHVLQPGNTYDTEPILLIPSNEILIPSGHEQDHVHNIFLEPASQGIPNDMEDLYSSIQRNHIENDLGSETGESRNSHTRKFIGSSPRDKRAVETWREWAVNIIHTIFWDPYDDPEFSTVQQNTWAILLGIVMGVFTAKWGDVIEYCVYFVWVTIPEKLIEWGLFCSDLDACKALPLPHYIWMCPTLFGGVLAYISSILPKPIPSQNDWIDDLHRFGIMDHTTLIPLLLISTAGMASGLSLGPELPLVLSSGMVGSFVALKTKQSILSARVINLTAGAGAIGGFFGFPMAGALFILELPHRMGLQYFEALSPATISSIFAVLVNRMVTGDDIKGYFNYPYLTKTLPNHIFYIAIVYGAVGSIIGLLYVKTCLSLKGRVHRWVESSFSLLDDSSAHQNHEACYMRKTCDEGKEGESLSEQVFLVDSKQTIKSRYGDFYERSIIKPIVICLRMFTTFVGSESKPIRAALAGSICGFCVGLICMFVPHSLFWGESQLQTIIDRGRTALPVLGSSGSTTTITAYGFCLLDPDDPAALADGFGIGCAALISVSKVLAVALSLSTGIVGGQFWGPLFVGCAASHFFTDLMAICKEFFGFGEILSAYPCVAILCIMGSAHTVTFRAHMAIMLILTLTVSAFSPSGGLSSSESGGDYSAVFPLLVVACYVPLMLTRSLRYYSSQHCRGDIIAIPAVLCEPRKYGTTAYPVHEPFTENDDEDDDYCGNEPYSDYESRSSEIIDGNSDILGEANVGISPGAATQDDLSAAAIERQFHERLCAELYTANNYGAINPLDNVPTSPELSAGNGSQDMSQSRHRRTGSDKSNGSYIFRDRRSRGNSIERSERGHSQERPSEQLSLVRSFGEVDTFQPCLLTQARERGSSGRSHTPINGIPVHPKQQQQKFSRQRSNSQASLGTATDSSITYGGLSLEDSERGWNSVSNYR